MYSLWRRGLFLLPPEVAHRVVLTWLDCQYRFNRVLMGGAVPMATHPVDVMGLSFPNRIGLAAGLDKNAECINGLAALGFGFVEVGTVTPRAQAGSPQPRLFRLPEVEAIINRMGFNNAGLEVLLANVRASQYRRRGGVLGINLGKNADTPIERAVDDYVYGLRAVYSEADYVTINISSPNTQNLRQLQQGDALDALLIALKQAQQTLADETSRYVPLVVKVAPDLSSDDIESISRSLVTHRIDGVITTNTTLKRDGLSAAGDVANETGGLSGAPLRELSNRVLALFARALDGAVPIIASGGVMSVADAQEKRALGADLVQVYSGLVYRGPALVRSLVTACR